MFDVGQVEAESATDPVAGDPPGPRQPADVGSVNAKGMRQRGSVQQLREPGRAKGIPFIATIGSGKLDDPSADHAGDPAGSSRAGLTSGGELWMAGGAPTSAPQHVHGPGRPRRANSSRYGPGEARSTSS